MDIFSLLQELTDPSNRDQLRLARNSTIQFGTPRRMYKGAVWLPGRPVNQNQFTEDKIVYRTVVANDGTRYSEPQLKQGELIGSFDVKLCELDIARQLTGKDLDNIRDVAADNPDRARSMLISWLNTAVNLALIEKEEAQRWQAIVNAQVPILGTDGKVTTVQLSSPSGHRVTIPSGTVGSPAGWYDTTGAYDPFDDIFAARDFLRDKGYTVIGQLTSNTLLSVLQKSPAVKQRVGMTTFSGGDLVTRSGSATVQSLNAEFAASELPPIETYDLTYNTQVGSQHFFPRNAFVLRASTLRDEEIDLGDSGYKIVSDTLGYYATGLAVGETTPGRVIRSTVSTMKPVGLYSQGWETGFPVVTEPEALFVFFVNPPMP